MTQVNFYTLSSEEEESRLQFACRLAEKAVSLGHSVFIRVENEQAAKRLDNLLWEFRASSFLPHALAAESAGDQEKILIGDSNQSPVEMEVLINLSTEPNSAKLKYQKINEILSTDPEVLAAGRVSYRAYQGLGYSLETHKL